VYNNNSAPGVGQVRIGGVARKVLNLENIFLHCWCHWKFVGCFNNLRKGFSFSTILGKKRDKDTNIHVIFWTSFRFCGFRIAITPMHLSMLASIHLQVFIKPKTLPPQSYSKGAIFGFNRMLCFLSSTNNFAKSLKWSSEFDDFTTISST